MDEERAAILAEFREYLENAIARAKVNFATAERLSVELQGKAGAHGVPLQAIRKSTLHDHVRGSRHRLPSWTWVTNLWAFLNAAAAQNRVDPARIGTLAEWEAAYEATEAKLRRLGERPDGAGTRREPSPHDPAVADPSSTWWAGYADLVAPRFSRYLNMEPLCGDVRCYADLYFPDLLQTPDYAAAVARLRNPGATRAEIARRVELCVLRQQLLPHEDRRVWALINELALWNPVADSAVMKRQLRHLFDVAARMPIQIVPAQCRAARLASGPITVLRFRHQSLPDTVYLEEAGGALYPDDPKLRATYLKQFGDLAIAAYRPRESRAIIRRLIGGM
ncbi:DUF5753 domain-containing protein [Actinomadura flavalba]|uniref:DUF5753 domain-containing protein n=1 Tax=Actinomadura flavalba TaxID=1120938 RepID=UPI00039C93CE|nr:DUF5753 domain-containing protein [Actinomadura flavalba]